MKRFKGKEVPVSELMERRILIEANRTFFHSLGMHLQFNEQGQLVITREDKYIHYGGFTSRDQEAIAQLQSMILQNNTDRLKALGFQYQPTQIKESRSIERQIYKRESELLQIHSDLARLQKQSMDQLEKQLKLRGDERIASEQFVERTRKTIQELKEKEVNLLHTIEMLRASSEKETARK